MNSPAVAVVVILVVVVIVVVVIVTVVVVGTTNVVPWKKFLFHFRTVHSENPIFALC